MFKYAYEFLYELSDAVMSSSKSLEIYYKLRQSKSFFKFYQAFKNNYCYQSVQFNSQEEKTVAESMAKRKLANRISYISQLKQYLEWLKWIGGIGVKSISCLLKKPVRLSTDIMFFAPDFRMKVFLTPIMSAVRGATYMLESVTNVQVVPISLIEILKITSSRFKYEIHKLYFKKSLEQLSPKLVVIAEIGGFFESEILAEVCEEKGIDLVCIQYGWCLKYAPIQVEMCRYSAFLVWGESVRLQLSQYRPDMECVNVGSPVLTPPVIEKKTLKKRILKLYPAAYPLVDSEWKVHHIELAILLQKKWPSFKVVYRPHPTELLSAKQSRQLISCGITYENPFDVSLGTSLSEAVVVISNLSTVLYESVSSQKATVCYNPTVTVFQEAFDQYFGRGACLNSL